MSIDSSDVSSLAQDSMKIVDMYIKKFSIKALRIEESDETLIIMRKPPHEKLPNEHGTEVVPFLAIKQEPIENSPSNLFSPKNEPAAGDICIQIKIEPDLIIEDIGEDSMDSRPVNSPVQTTAEPKEHSPKDQQIQSTQETNPNQIEILLNMNQQILELIQEINSKVENLGQNVSRVEKMYESDEDFEPSGKLVDLPDNLKCDTLTEVLNLNRILQFQDNQEKLERILKLRLAAFRENYKLLLKEGLNILMSKPTQYLICPDGQSVLKTSRAVTSLLKITNEIFGIPMKHIERYIYHQLFTKKSIT